MPTNPSQRYSLPDGTISSLSTVINDDNDAQQFQQIIRDRRGTSVSFI